LSIKTKLIGGARALAIAGGMLAFAAPAANAAVTQIGSCQNLLALGSAKSSTINPATTKPYGIADVDNIDGSIGAKGVDPNVNKGTNLGSCSFPSNSTQGVPDSGKPVQVWSNGTHNLTKWSTKLFSREFDCDTTDTTDTTEWSPSGALSMTFADLNNLGKNQSITAQITVDGFTDPDSNPATPSDVVKFHGIVTKGAALGSDVTGETEFDPTVKDSSQTTATPYFGYNFDIGAALGCTTATKGDANIVTFNNGSVGGVSQLLGLPVAGIKFNKGVA
jgi:hypothetical protein